MIYSYDELKNNYVKGLRYKLSCKDRFDEVLDGIYNEADSDSERARTKQLIDYHNQVQNNVDKYIDSVIKVFDNIVFDYKKMDKFAKLEKDLFGGTGDEQLYGSKMHKWYSTMQRLNIERAETTSQLRYREVMLKYTTHNPKNKLYQELIQEQQDLTNKMSQIEKEENENKQLKKLLDEYSTLLKDIDKSNKIMTVFNKNRFYQGNLVNLYMACEIEGKKAGINTDKLFEANIMAISSNRRMAWEKNRSEEYQYKKQQYGDFQEVLCFNIDTVCKCLTLSAEELTKVQPRQTIICNKQAVVYKDFTLLPINGNNYNKCNNVEYLEEMGNKYDAYYKENLDYYINNEQFKKVLDYEYRKINPNMYRDQYYIKGNLTK